MDNQNLGVVFQSELKNLKNKIIRRGDLPYISVEDQLKYVDELAQFPLGRILLEKRSIDTEWTDYIITHTNKKKCAPLEDFILNRSPFTKGWRELLKNFQKLSKENLKDGVVLASIPCGAMRELLELDYSSISNFTIIGIDIDLNSLSLAKKFAIQKGLSKNIRLYQQDAWKLPYNSEIDIITSCGLNIYISDQKKVLDLYRQFFKALKPGGKLIIGFLTYPPEEAKDSEWRLKQISSKDILLEKILYKDILDVEWRNFRTSKEFESELRMVGFTYITFYYDELHVFPTIIAKKE